MSPSRQLRGPLRVLLLCDDRSDIAATVKDHIDALCGRSAHHVETLSIVNDWPRFLDLGGFDAVVVHYSAMAAPGGALGAAGRRQLAAFPGLKAAFLQDEYRHVNRTIDVLREIGIHVLFTCVPAPEIDKVYPPNLLPDTAKVDVLTGYVPERLLTLPVRAYENRRIDIGYRSRKLPPWLGALGVEKHAIGERTIEQARACGLRVDISTLEADRLYGRRWTRFLSDCKAVLGVESGASVFDFTGEIQRKVEAHLHRHPDASFDELQRLYFLAEEDRINLRQISPRCFEAAALGTLMVLYEGAYSGILEPWRHYVPLRKDHANFAQVVEVIRSPEAAKEIIARARRDIAINPRYGYGALSALFDEALRQAFVPEMAATKTWSAAAYEASVRPFCRRQRRRQWQRRAKENVMHMVSKLIGLTVPRAHQAQVRRVVKNATAAAGAKLGVAKPVGD